MINLDLEEWLFLSCPNIFLSCPNRFLSCPKKSGHSSLVVLTPLELIENPVDEPPGWVAAVVSFEGITLGFREDFLEARSQKRVRHLKKLLGFLQLHAGSFEEFVVVVLEGAGLLQAFLEGGPRPSTFNHASSILDFLGGCDWFGGVAFFDPEDQFIVRPAARLGQLGPQDSIDDFRAVELREYRVVVLGEDLFAFAFGGWNRPPICSRIVARLIEKGLDLVW